MAQLIPSVLFYSQAVKVINEIGESFSADSASVEEILLNLNNALTVFQNTVGEPFTSYEPVVETEPPLSSKMNRLWNNIEADINILQHQEDLLRAATIFAHNLVTTEILRSRNANARVSNKLKTLQLYSESVDSSIITFGDFFRNEEFLDLTIVPVNDRAKLAAQGVVTLNQKGGVNELAEDSIITLVESNGFLGNLHEIEAETRQIRVKRAQGERSANDPDSEFIFIEQPIFKAESSLRADLDEIVDNEPNTWIEYESCLIKAEDRQLAKNLGFTYKKITNEGAEEVDWANGPPGGVLKLGLQFDLRSVQTINYISYIPFNLEDNVNLPVKIHVVQTSINGTDWEEVKPKDLFVGTTPNIPAARVSENVLLGDAVWAFAGRSARYVRIYIEQPNPINRRLGHVYYIDKDGKRVPGPVPPINDPARDYNPSLYSTGDLLQRREVFDGKRWAIGIRDISILKTDYDIESMLVTKPLRVGGLVDRVSLEADVTIPSEYASDVPWVLFYLSPDDGVSWHAISRIQDDFLSVPEIMAFNDPLPAEFQEPGVRYVYTDDPVKSLRLKIVLLRPQDFPSTTPILKSYRLKVKRR
ncbi:MAG TPA: discoidin domain-containing protein [Nitrososphaera sp.]|nr:discoidin domain-containing protein [Nitrososphaera sp.]